MKMNFSIFYRVVYEPSRVFEGFSQRAYFEAVIPVLAVASLNTTRAYLRLPQMESVGSLLMLAGLVAGFAYGVIAILIFPFLSTIYVFALRRRMCTRDITLRSLFTAFLLCAFPMYLGALLGSLSDLFYFGLGYLFRSTSETHPFLYGMLLPVTPFFLWTILLWWIALTVLLRPGRYQRFFLVGSLLLLEMLIGGFQSGAWSTFVRFLTQSG
jgi:hypothetical protein